MEPELIVLMISAFLSLVITISISNNSRRTFCFALKEKLFTIFFVTSLFVIIITTLTIKQIPSQSLIISPQGKIMRVVENYKSDWSWNYINYTIESFAPQSNAFEMKVNPITDNPKVRNLQYTVEVEILGTPDDYLNYKKTLGKKSLQQWLGYWLLEFNNSHSKQLGAFSNYYDDQQQTEFNKLIKKYIGPKLVNTGIRFKNAKFTAV
jgi:hypothetical protein